MKDKWKEEYGELIYDLIRRLTSGKVRPPPPPWTPLAPPSRDFPAEPIVSAALVRFFFVSVCFVCFVCFFFCCTRRRIIGPGRTKRKANENETEQRNENKTKKRLRRELSSSSNNEEKKEIVKVALAKQLAPPPVGTVSRWEHHHHSSASRCDLINYRRVSGSNPSDRLSTGHRPAGRPEFLLDGTVT